MISTRRGIACFLAICLALPPFLPPAAGSYFKDQSYPDPYAYSLYSSPVLVNASPPGLTVTELTDTDVIAVAPGEIINVSLGETNPHLNWEFMGGDGVRYLGNSLVETYPVRHLFKLKADNSCTVRFEMIDDRDGKVLKTFAVNLIIVWPVSGLGWPALSLDLVPSFGWPPGLKF